MHSKPISEGHRRRAHLARGCFGPQDSGLLLKQVNREVGKRCTYVLEKGRDLDIVALHHEDRAQTLDSPTEAVGPLAESDEGEVLHQVGDPMIYEALVDKAHSKDQGGTNRARDLGPVNRKLPELEALYPLSARSRTLVK